MSKNRIDILENYICKIDENLLAILLKDHSTNRNIIWATDNYEKRGGGYQYFDQITPISITGRNGGVIKPRIAKSKKEIDVRVKERAEVFTPSWICNLQNNLVDKEWFTKKTVFNYVRGNAWVTCYEKIKFPDGKIWQDYVIENRLEISCGEAPYLVSRYDTVSGEFIPVKRRIGLLDRKLRIVSENINNECEWVYWAKEAIKSTYGYDWQGDNILLARENILFTFADYYYDKFENAPMKEYLLEVAEIISWNIWQMDGLKGVVPSSCKPREVEDVKLWGVEKRIEECQGCKHNDLHKHNGIYCKIMDWETNNEITFVSLLRG